MNAPHGSSATAGSPPIPSNDAEAFYAALAEMLPQNMLRKDLNGRFTYANRRFCETIGKPLHEILGKTDFDLFPPELAAKYQEDDHAVLQSLQTYESIEAHQTSDGSKLYVHVLKAPLFDVQSRIAGTQCIFWDVTEQKMMEEDLAYERDLLRALLQFCPDRIYFKDSQCRFIKCSKSLVERLGYRDVHEAIGKTDFDLFGEIHARDAYDDERRIMHTGEPIIAKTEREIWKDGRESWVLTTKLPLRNKSGEIIGTFGISKDITELKRTEAELALARDAALLSARLKSEFLANMSHEIRTPLNAIVGMSDLLLNTRLSEEQSDFAHTIHSSANVLLALINDILDFSKIEAGKLSIESIEFNLGDLIEETVAIFAEKAEAKGLELATWIPDQMPAKLRGDPNRIRQILTNLLGNAIKFTESGEVLLTVSVETRSKSNVILRCSVKDTGVGIPWDAQPRLFQVFTQADGSTTRKYGGTGLGLAISKQLVELMHGQIGFESTPGQGSTFWFELPLRKQAGPARALKKRNPLEKLTVLIVDDNATNRRILERQTAGWNMLHSSASNGPDAITMLRRASATGNSFDFVLLDMQMPGMDGLTVAKTIQNDPAISPTRVVMLTSMAHRLDDVTLQNAGILAHLTKPVKSSRLCDCLMELAAEKECSPQPLEPLATHPDSPDRGPIRVLLVEDHAVNRKVAALQLQKLGFTIQAVEDGLQAIDAIQKEPFDIVLMDCQMPRMDGYEASRFIREHEAKRRDATTGPRSSLYIIAMTANALVGDREKCIAAGMDDYICKPVTLPVLQAALNKGIEAIRSHPAPAPSPAPSQRGRARRTSPPVNPDLLEHLRALRVPGQPDPLAEVIDLFLHDSPKRIRQLRSALEKQDAAELSAEAHAFKGSASNLGAENLARLCAELEAAARQNAFTPAATILSQIQLEFQAVRRFLKHAQHRELPP